MKNLLLTGAAGFWGQCLAPKLAAAGWHVVGTDIVPPKKKIPELDFVTGSLVEARHLRQLQALGPWDAIVHLAGRRPSGGEPVEVYPGLYEANTAATSVLLEACAGKQTHFVLASSALVYGEQSGPFVETMAPYPVHPYAVTKLLAEQAVSLYAHRTGMSFCVLRPSVLYGPNQGQGMFLPDLANALKKREIFPMTPAQQTRDFLHIDDASNAVVLILQSMVQGIFNLGFGRSVVLAEVAKEAEKLMGDPGVIQLGAKPYRPGESMEYGLDTTALQKATGWKAQISLRQGLLELLQ